jgi:hypothetical protein
MGRTAAQRHLHQLSLQFVCVVLALPGAEFERFFEHDTDKRERGAA